MGEIDQIAGGMPEDPNAPMGDYGVQTIQGYREVIDRDDAVLSLEPFEGGNPITVELDGVTFDEVMTDSDVCLYESDDNTRWLFKRIPMGDDPFNHTPEGYFMIGFESVHGLEDGFDQPGPPPDMGPPGPVTLRRSPTG